MSDESGEMGIALRRAKNPVKSKNPENPDADNVRRTRLFLT